MEHLYKPERWRCRKCDLTLIQRKMRNPKGTCRNCGAKESDVTFVPGKNQCKPCRSEYHRKYVQENYEELRRKHRASYRRDRVKRKRAVYKAIQRSPEAFLRDRWHHIRSKGNRRRKEAKTLENPDRVAVSISFEEVLDLWEEQEGRCSLSGLKMEHVWGSPRSVSIDRIDSDVGYHLGNVQLVCSAMNFMKRSWPQEDILAMLGEMGQVSRD